MQSYESFLKRQSISLFFTKKSSGFLLSLKIIMYFSSQSKTMLIVDCWRCQLRVIKMPSHGVGDAFYGGIVGFTHSVSSHPLLSWKVSERPLVGIVISIPPILQCLDSNIKNRIKIQKKRCKFTSTSTKSLETLVFTSISRGGGGSEI